MDIPVDVIISVGTTRFDELSDLGASAELLAALAAAGFRSLFVQHGAAPFAPPLNPPLAVTSAALTPGLPAMLAEARLVIGHAGVGVSLDALRGGAALVVVPNAGLQGGHQAEWAAAVAATGAARAAGAPGGVAGLVREWSERGWERAELPPPRTAGLARDIEALVG